MKRNALVFAAALLLTALTAAAQSGTWTAVGSTGTIDPNHLGLAGVIGGTRLGFNPAGGSNSGTILTRFNVTNTYGGGIDDTPSWTTLQLGALNTGFPDTVSATLYRVSPCSGARVAICTTTNSGAGSGGSCSTCTFASTTFNFASFLYYVEVNITRAVGTGNPQLSTLRIF